MNTALSSINEEKVTNLEDDLDRKSLSLSIVDRGN